MSDKELQKQLEEERASRKALMAQVEQLTALLAAMQGAEKEKKEKSTARSRRNNAVTKCKVAYADAQGYEPTEEEIITAMASMKKRG